MHRNPTIVLALLVATMLAPSCRAHVDAEDQQPTEVAVDTGSVVRATLRDYLDVFGSVAPEPAAGGQPGGAARLAAPAPGIVRAVLVAEGQSVHAGDLIVRLDDRVARAEAERARAAVRYAEQVLERQRTLWEQHNTSQKRLEVAQQELALARADLGTARGVLARVQLRSPLDGVVSRVRVAPGQTVDQSTVVAEIVDLHRLVVLARVPVAEAHRVAIGQGAEVSTGHSGDAAVPGTVSFTSPSVDPASGTVLVRLAVTASASLQPGRLVRARIAVAECKACLAVPAAAVYTAADGEASLSIVIDGVAHRKPVRAGVRDRGLVEIEGDGVAEGMTVVTVGAYALPDQTRVRIQRAAAERP